MIISGWRRGFYYFGHKYSRDHMKPIHGPTTDLWTLGDGIIQKKNMLVSGWNVNGYRSIIKKGQLQPFISSLQPDFLCLNQTKIDLKAYRSEIQNKISYQGYYQYWNFCKISSGYSGVMTLTPHKPISVIEDIPSEARHSLQGRILTLQYESFFLVNIYKPNSGSKCERLHYRTQQYDYAFTKYMKHLLSIKNVIIVGDFNVAHTPIDLSNPVKHKEHSGFTNEERKTFDDLLAVGFTDTFRTLHIKKVQYTYWSYLFQARNRNVGWRIDYVLASQGLAVLEANIHDGIQGSDHCPVSALIHLN